MSFLYRNNDILTARQLESLLPRIVLNSSAKPRKARHKRTSLKNAKNLKLKRNT